MNRVIFCWTFIFLLLTAQVAEAQCGTRKLDSRVASFLQLIGYKDHTLDELRQLPMAVHKFSGPPLVPYPAGDLLRVKVTADSIPVLIFNPLHADHLPVLINYHGGGFIAPLIPALEHSLWQDAKTYGAIVFAVDYRVAPEHRFPAAVNDSYEAFKWIAAHAQEYGGDTGRIVLMGNSAGANLVAVITHRARNEGIAGKIKLQVLNGLPADLRPSNMESSASYRENTVGYFQTRAACYFAVENYAPGRTDDPEVSPALARDFSGLPPAVIINSEFDPLRDDGVLYAGLLRKQGIRVWEKCFSGQIHLLLGLPPDAAEIGEMETMVRVAMKECVGKR